jgi:hypothetical protein
MAGGPATKISQPSHLHLYMKKATDDDDATSASNDCSGSGQLVRLRAAFTRAYSFERLAR